MHSLQVVQFLGFDTTTCPSSISNTLAGHKSTNFLSSFELAPGYKRISGINLYEAVATGDHFACVAPIPFSQCKYASISCPSPNCTIRISSCTGLTSYSLSL